MKLDEVQAPDTVQRGQKAKVLAGAETTVEVVTYEGEVLLKVPMAPGEHDLAPYQSYLADGEYLQVTNGRVILVSVDRVVPERAPRRHETGANPNWSPSSQYSETRRMEQLIRKVEERVSPLEKRAKAAEAALAKLNKPKPAAPPAPAPEPEAEPEKKAKETKSEPKPDKETEVTE